MCVLINALRKPSLGALGYKTKILQVKSGQKVDDFEPIYLGNYHYWWKMVCDFWAHCLLAFFWLCSFTPTWMLFFFFFFFFLTFFFLILLRLSTFKPLNALYSKFQRLKISGSGRTSARLKLGVPGWGNPPKRVPQNFKIWQNLGVPKWRDPSQTRTTKLKTAPLTLDWWNFQNRQMGKDEVWQNLGVPLWRTPQMRMPKFTLFTCIS